MLPVPIETLRVRIGLIDSDASRDDDINAASAVTLALMANYCDRYFDEVVDGVQDFTHVTGESLSLNRYPVTEITSMLNNMGNEFTLYHLGEYTGIIHFDYPVAFHTLSVTSTAGYAEGEFPDDLLIAYYSIFDQQFAAMESGATISTTNIESVTVADVGTVRYGSNDSMGGGFIPPIAGSILDAYKRYQS